MKRAITLLALVLTVNVTADTGFKPSPGARACWIWHDGTRGCGPFRPSVQAWGTNGKCGGCLHCDVNTPCSDANYRRRYGDFPIGPRLQGDSIEADQSLSVLARACVAGVFGTGHDCNPTWQEAWDLKATVARGTGLFASYGYIPPGGSAVTCVNGKWGSWWCSPWPTEIDSVCRNASDTAGGKNSPACWYRAGGWFMPIVYWCNRENPDCWPSDAPGIPPLEPPVPPVEPPPVEPPVDQPAVCTLVLQISTELGCLPCTP